MREAETQCKPFLIHPLGGAILMKPDDSAFELTRFRRTPCGILKGSLLIPWDWE
jgi:hypothetical protein